MRILATLTRTVLFAAICGAFLCVTPGCKAEGGTTQEELTRHSLLVAFPIENATPVSPVLVNGIVPALIGADPNIRRGDPDYDHGKSEKDAVKRVELDFGDGGGWQDVTQDVHDLFDGKLRPSPNSLDHLYTTPGEFHVQIRVTFWDGEVIGAMTDPVVVITAAP